MINKILEIAMSYFSGVFDAEGWVSLMKTGHFMVGIEMTSEKCIHLFQDRFKGNIYSKKRKNKPLYMWCIATNTQEIISFFDQIIPYSLIKKEQLVTLKNYLNHSRKERRQIRQKSIQSISALKKPVVVQKDYFNKKIVSDIEEDFFSWLAGFFDGDGTFSIYEYKNPSKITFDSYISIFNIFPEPIKHVNERIHGSIIKNKGTNFPIWKWVCNQKNSRFVCQNLLPFLQIKKEQCKIMLEYLIFAENRGTTTNLSFKDQDLVRHLIKQIKHFNSL